MNPDDLLSRYRELQNYAGWTDDAARLVAAVSELLAPHLPALVDDFYNEIDRHPFARKVITGGPQQVERLKASLHVWLRELLSGLSHSEYVNRRWRVGWRHAEIGLDQVYTNMALSRLRTGLMLALQTYWTGPPDQLAPTIRAVNQRLDLDLALIEDAFQAEYAARLQRGERLAAIGQVAGGIAHELRNPLNVVKTSVYYLLHARRLTPQKQAEHLQRIERNVSLADGVITALTNFVRLPVPNLQRFDLGACLRDVVSAIMIDPTSGTSAGVAPLSSGPPIPLRVVLDCPDGLEALADQPQIRIVFDNLVRNAREAMPMGGTLSVVAEVVEDRVEVAFRDSGMGIAADQLSQIMEPLYSTKARGLGLGLAIARSILEKNGGSLRVISEQGQGSTFTVVLLPACSP